MDGLREGGAHRNPARQPHQTGDQFVVDAAVDVGARARHAGLARRREDPGQHPDFRAVDVGVLEDDVRALAAQLERARDELPARLGGDGPLPLGIDVVYGVEAVLVDWRLAIAFLNWRR